MSHELNPSQNIGLGIVTAIIEGLILQPTLYWKNAKALKLPFTINPRIIYRGTAASMYNEMQMMGLQFGLTGFFNRLFLGSNDAATSAAMTNGQTFASATLGGAISACFTSPVELIMIQQQKNGGTFIGTPLKITGAHGFLGRGLMRGLVPAILRDSIYVTGLLGFTPVAQSFLIDEYDISRANAGLVASMLGGIVASIPSHPFDICKTCMQGDLSQSVYRGFIQTLRLNWNDGGIRRIFQGCMWRTINITATVYIANECRTHLPDVLFSR
jgi:hypothetical protein